MKKRLSANTWVVIVLFTIIGLMAIDIGRSMLAGPGPEERHTPPSVDPKFKVGEKAPDFTLPDAKNVKHTLSDLVKQSKNDTLLWFTCGCAQCRGAQHYMSKLAKLMGDKAPTEINVTTMHADRLESWLRDTELRQTILLEPNAMEEGSVAMTYKGKPCPRFFHIKKDMTVAKIGDSPAINPNINIMSISLARELDFQLQGEKEPGKLVAPKPDIESAAQPAEPAKAGMPSEHSDHADHAGHSH